MMWGGIGVAIEVAALSVAWMMYRKGYGVGPGGVVPMLWGVAIGSVGLVVGGILGIVGLLAGLARNAKIALILSALAILIPLGVLFLYIIRKIGPL